MASIFPFHDPTLIALAVIVAILAGVIKGVVGFGMPMILLSGLSSFISVDVAIAALIIPTLLTNGLQALRQGVKAAVNSVKHHARFLIAGGVFMVASAQLVPFINTDVLIAVLGVIITGFAAMQLAGWQPLLHRPTALVETLVGAFTGVVGGFSGIWGPPTVAYLTAMNTKKQDQVRIQGVIYGLGAVVLTGAHIGSGVLNIQTAPFSAFLVVPALIGLGVGFVIQDRIDQKVFKRVTLFVLFFAGLNLLRRGLLV